MEIKRVGVVGCGAMGAGIAQVCAQAGYSVIVSEVNADLLRNGLAGIDRFLNKSVEKGKLAQDTKTEIRERITGTTDMKNFSECDLVIEAVPENIALKKKVFKELSQICSDSILASNTSGLSIIEMAIITGRPDQVVGLHFFNPPPIMKLLEVISTIATRDDIVKTCQEFGKSLGKIVVTVKDSPGFIVNRLSIPFTLNAIRILESGIATREDIDTAATSGLNHPMGPLELADFLGIDTLYHAACDMYEKTKDPQFAPPLLLQHMIAAGWVGRKAGRGFYEHK